MRPFGFCSVVTLFFVFVASALPAHAASVDTYLTVTGITSGTTLKGSVRISAKPLSSAVESDISSVRFVIDGPMKHEMKQSNSPYGMFGDTAGSITPWDTTTFPNGSYTLTITVATAGGSTYQKAYPFSIANAISGIGEYVKLNGLTPGATLSGGVKIYATPVSTAQQAKISSVTFDLSGARTYQVVEKQAPYALMKDDNGTVNAWNTATYPNGSYTLKLTLLTTDGKTLSASYPFTVGNSASAPPPASSSGTTYYVAKGGSNGDARSTATAWSDLNKIVWSRVRPGDTIAILPGTYEGAFSVDASGTAGAPITIRAPQGGVTIDGGGSLLPYCKQASVSFTQGRHSGIYISGRSYVVVDGVVKNGIRITNSRFGVYLNKSPHITLRRVEIYNNGIYAKCPACSHPEITGTMPDEEGIHIENSQYLTVDKAEIHDNGSDAIQISGGTDGQNLTVTDSWLYNARLSPSGGVFNACSHPDGIQYVSTSKGSGFEMQDSIMGPGLYHTILGNSMKNVLFRNVLVYDSLTSPFAGRETSTAQWTLDHVTSVTYRSPLHLELSGSGHTIRDSIFVGGRQQFPSSTVKTNNYHYNDNGSSVGSLVNPRFRDEAKGDYAPTAYVNGAGSKITKGPLPPRR